MPMLKTRVITALVLLALLLPSLFFLPQAYWALLVALFIGVAAWEWGGLLGFGQGATTADRRGAGHTLCRCFPADPVAIGAAAGGALGVPWVMAVLWYCRALLVRSHSVLAASEMETAAWLAWPADRYRRSLSDLAGTGPVAGCRTRCLAGDLATVWMADIAAYFSGKTFGKHKLAPTISPGKTWEGAIGAGIGVVLYGIALRLGFSFEPVGLPLWVLGLLAVTAISIMGDLYESMLKRQAGIKDSSNVLPGHGGVLDRIDSLTSTLPVVALLWLLVSRGQG